MCSNYLLFINLLDNYFRENIAEKKEVGENQEPQICQANVDYFWFRKNPILSEILGI